MKNTAYDWNTPGMSSVAHEAIQYALENREEFLARFGKQEYVDKANEMLDLLCEEHWVAYVP
jgi:hypothetical protein